MSTYFPSLQIFLIFGTCFKRTLYLQLYVFSLLSEGLLAFWHQRFGGNETQEKSDHASLKRLVFY